MTDKDLTAKLQSHKGWIGNQYGGGKRADFRGADLRNVSFEGVDLRWADFRASDCRGANFTKANARNVDFRGADLTGAVFIGTQLQHARLEGANLSGVDFRSAVMEFAQLTGANASRQYMPERQAPEKPRAKQRDLELER